MTIQTRHSNWIEKNWKFKQNIQIELKKIENSNKTFKLNWKKLKIQTNNQIELKKIWTSKFMALFDLKLFDLSVNMWENWFELNWMLKVWFEQS